MGEDAIAFHRECIVWLTAHHFSRGTGCLFFSPQFQPSVVCLTATPLTPTLSFRPTGHFCSFPTFPANPPGGRGWNAPPPPDCGIGDGGAVELAAALRTNNTVERLSLSSAPSGRDPRSAVCVGRSVPPCGPPGGYVSLSVSAREASPSAPMGGWVWRWCFLPARRHRGLGF